MSARSATGLTPPQVYREPVESPSRDSTAAVAPSGETYVDLVDRLVVADSDRLGIAQTRSALELLRPLLRAADAGNAESHRQLIDLVGRTMTRIDKLLTRQLNCIIHHPRFKQLEASWRGLRYLVDQSDPGANVQIRMLNVTWEELAKDAEHALDFDRSVLFQKVYEEEFGVSGGEPFGVLLGDYEIRHRLTPEHPINDIAALSSIAQTATAAFAPFIAGAHPSLLGMNGFGELERPPDFDQRFALPEYAQWNSFRESEDARFVGLTAPRMLMRLPYDRDVADHDLPFAFQEDQTAPRGADYLWGNSAYAFGAVLIRAFAETGWFTDIRGFRRRDDRKGSTDTRDVEGGGVVEGLPVHGFYTDAEGIAVKFSTDVAVTDSIERALTDAGVISLCRCKDTELSAFHGNPSLQKAKIYSEDGATNNAKLSAMLQYIFCASRIAHYLKIMGRDLLGSFIEPAELQNRLTEWLAEKTNTDDNASPQRKAEYPLRQSTVSVIEEEGRSGSYICKMMLMPHSQADQLTVGINLVTRMTGARAPGAATRQ